MLRFFDVVSRTSTGITFNTGDIPYADYVPYVFYDTSTGYTTLRDYYAWRTVTSTGTVAGTTNFTISNATLFPKVAPPLLDYNLLDVSLITVLTYVEFMVIQNVLQRIDLVRRRLPNPGIVISSNDGYGNNGVASVAGGYDKKFSVAELMNFIEGSLIEINIHSPATEFYWSFTSVQTEKLTNPYHLQNYMGVPYKFLDLIVQGAIIRALYAWGLLEVDLQFNTSDAGLQITYDKVSSVSSWVDKLLAEFIRQKDFIKMDCVNSRGVGVGTLPFMAAGIWGTAMNMIQTQGTLPMSSMLGFNLRSNTPL
jgi:hypothetical protein